MLDLLLFVVIVWLIVYLVVGTIAAILVARVWRRIDAADVSGQIARSMRRRRESHATTDRHVV